MNSDANDLLTQYQVEVNNIDRLKARQWTVMYYTFLVYFVIYLIKDNYEGQISPILVNILLSIITSLVMGFGLWYIYSTESTMSEYRFRMAKIATKHFSQSFAEILDPKDMTGPKGQDIAICCFFSGMLLIGSVILLFGFVWEYPKSCYVWATKALVFIPIPFVIILGYIKMLKDAKKHETYIGRLQKKRANSS